MTHVEQASGYELLEQLSREGWTVAVVPAETGGFALRPAGELDPSDWLMLAARKPGWETPLCVFGASVAEMAPQLVRLCHAEQGEWL